MKYGFWTSTSESNQMINAIYKQAQQEGKTLFLIMGTNCDTNAYGVAIVTSKLLNDQFPMWWQNIKYNGTFKVEWVYVKTVNLAGIKVKEENCGLHELPNGSEINSLSGMKVINYFDASPIQGNILDLFPVLDIREDRLMNMRRTTGVEIKLTKMQNSKAQNPPQKNRPFKEEYGNPRHQNSKSGFQNDRRNQNYGGDDRNGRYNDQDNYYDQNSKKKYPVQERNDSRKNYYVQNDKAPKYDQKNDRRVRQDEDERDRRADNQRTRNDAPRNQSQKIRGRGYPPEEIHDTKKNNPVPVSAQEYKKKPRFENEKYVDEQRNGSPKKNRVSHEDDVYQPQDARGGNPKFNTKNVNQGNPTKFRGN